MFCVYFMTIFVCYQGVDDGSTSKCNKRSNAAVDCGGSVVQYSSNEIIERK